MKNKASTITALTLAFLGAHYGISAMGGIGRPSEGLVNRSLYLPEMRKQAEENLEELKAKEAKNQAAAIARIQILSSLRPVSREADIGANAMANQRKSFFEQLFNDDLANDMKVRYQNNISPIEAKINSPYRRAQIWEMQQYDNSRSEMASWTAKEVLDNKLKELFRGADKDSGAMQVISAMREVTGNAPVEEKKPDPKITEQEKIARAHRLDLPKEAEEEHIPTKLKTRFNVLKRVGNLNFSNPIVTTNVDLDLTNQDKVSVNMSKDFKKLAMKSRAQFGLNRRILNMNVNKTITDQISLDLDSTHYTGQERGAGGEKNLESARVTYSLSF